MGRVLTNNTNLMYTIESALGVAGTTWFNLEPNDINAFGASITTVSRDPISANRQRRKGTVTDLDSAVEFEADLTISAFRDFIEGFCFVTGVNTDVTQLAVTQAGTTADDFTVTALSAAQANKMEIGTLIYVQGFTDSSNNGLFEVDADIATSATLITVVENLVDETPAAAGELSFAGMRIQAADTVTWTWDGSALTGTLSETGSGTLAQALGMTVGQVVHIGSDDGAGAVQNAFENAAANDMYGYCRVKEFTDADTIVFDKVGTALQFTDGTSPATDLDIMFGEFIRNVATSHADYLERSFHFEAEYVNLDDPNNEYEYSKGNYCSTIAFNLPLSDKATCTFAFLGTDTDSPVVAGSRKSGASSATDPTMTAAYNTTADIARLRITEVDETGLTTDFKSIELTLNNNVSPEKVLGTLGAKYMNTGNFEVDMEAQLIFSEGLVVNKIRDNETVTMDFIIKNDDGAIAVDIPSMTMGDGSKEFPVNESVLINVGGMAFQDATLGYSIGISIFPFVP